MKSSANEHAPGVRQTVKHGRALLLAATAAVCLVGGLLPLCAQHKKEPTERLIAGTVVDKDKKPLPGAVVYVKDEKTLQVKSYLTDEGGHFRFGQLSLATDYDLWATMNGKRSKTKSISTFNSRPELNYTLRLDTAPGDAPAKPSAKAAPDANGAAQTTPPAASDNTPK